MKLKDVCCVALIAGVTVFIGTGHLSVGTGLLAGLIIALVFRHTWAVKSRYLSSLSLQISIVLMGFGLNVNDVLTTAQSTFGYIALTITLCALAGWLLVKLLGVEQETGILITSGTAICGGSAIAAVSRVLNSRPEHTAVAVTVIFLLNLVALFLFPAIGHWLEMSQFEFGVWAALSIHDTSSVVGAAASYGEEALSIATTTKLARALWILPLTLVASLFVKDTKSRVTIPAFILLFVGATLVASALPQFHDLYANLATSGKRVMVLALFLLGLGITPEIIRTVSVKPFMLGFLLWATLAISSLVVIKVF
jgi:uncharacterized integral membrane protein (TIGR00698 family)